MILCSTSVFFFFVCELFLTKADNSKLSPFVLLSSPPCLSLSNCWHWALSGPWTLAHSVSAALSNESNTDWERLLCAYVDYGTHANTEGAEGIFFVCSNWMIISMMVSVENPNFVHAKKSVWACNAQNWTQKMLACNYMTYMTKSHSCHDQWWYYSYSWDLYEDITRVALKSDSDGVVFAHSFLCLFIVIPACYLYLWKGMSGFISAVKALFKKSSKTTEKCKVIKRQHLSLQRIHSIGRSPEGRKRMQSGRPLSKQRLSVTREARSNRPGGVSML